MEVEELENIVAIDTGRYYNLALNADGEIYAWGRNRHGQLGDGTQENRPVPVKTQGLDNVHTIAANDGSRSASYAVDKDGQLYYWGAVFYQQPHMPTLLPEEEEAPNLGEVEVEAVSLQTAVADDQGGEVFPPAGVYQYNRGDEVELRAKPAEDYRFVQWSDGHTEPWRTKILEEDADLTAEFVLTEPTLRLDQVTATPNEPVKMRLLMEDGKDPYAGLNAALHLPRGIDLVAAARGADVGDDFHFDYVTREAPDGGTLVSLIIFSADGSVGVKDAELAVLTLRARGQVEEKIFSISWVDGYSWTRCPQTVLAEPAGLTTVRPLREPGSLALEVENLVQAALRIAAYPAAVDEMSNLEFDAYVNRTHFRRDEPYTAEIWLQVIGSGAEGIESAYMDLQFRDEEGSMDKPVDFGERQHSGIFDTNTQAKIENSSLRGFGGESTGVNESGRSHWVRLGWMEVQAKEEAEIHSVELSARDGVPVLTNEAQLQGMAILDSPVTVYMEDILKKTTRGTPHWWLDEHELVDSDEPDYHATEQTDFRGDGITAHLAYMAGLDPVNKSSQFGISKVKRSDKGDVISWPALGGRRYRVYRSTTLKPGDWERVKTKDAEVNQIMTYTYEHEGDPEDTRFYRVVVEFPTTETETPYWWLENHGLVDSDESDHHAAEQVDYRGDGITAQQAYVAGLDPVDPASQFTIADVEEDETGDQISWPAVTGRRYRVYRSTTLKTEDWELVEIKDATANQTMTYTHEHEGDPEDTRFYRVVVELQ